MVIKKITERWWILTSDDGYLALTFFGESKGEVVQKFKAFVRDHELERIRYKPKGLRSLA